MLKKSLLILVSSFLLLYCRKDVDSVSTDPTIRLDFSENTILFDTIFTTVGSTTHQLKVYNRSNEAIRISSISITGDNKANFRMNVDGESGSEVKNVFVAGKDSLYIFIDVTIDPLNAKTPFLIEGKILFNTNGNLQEVGLLAYGQQAIFYTPDHFPEKLPPYRLIKDGEFLNFTWKSDTPIVIYGYVVIDSTQHLTIEEGSQIYLHANSGIWVYRYGRITVNGSIERPVVFQGDRLDEYKDIAGSWDRIWINEGNALNRIENAVIKNSFIGIQAEYDPFTGYKQGISSNLLVLDNVIIENSKFSGIYATNFRILARNLLISNSGQTNFFVSGGGEYDFRHCTFANYWRGETRDAPAVFLSQLYYDFDAKGYRQDSMNVFFGNSIIYGDKESEFAIEDEVDPGKKINFTFQNSLVRTDIDTSKYGTYRNSLLNPVNATIFKDPYGGKFELHQNSPARDKGDPALLIDFDLKGKMRDANSPDLGVYEHE